MNRLNIKTIIKGNELLHHFVGGKWRAVDKSRPHHFIDADFRTKSICKKACDTANRHIPAELHWIPVPYPLEAAMYHASWDKLMDVIEKIESFHLWVRIWSNECEIVWLGGGADEYGWLAQFTEIFQFQDDNTDPSTIHYTKIQATWLCAVSFVQWYNKHGKIINNY